ncbi:MAG: DMT family transporter [Chloroflexota bacterium]|nr:DMT family transporter [Chloroflexota bacterium]
MSGELTFADKMPLRPLAVTEAIIATAIWSSSFVIVKIALPYMGPLTIAALRYFLAFLLLLPFMLRNGKTTRSVPSHLWIRLFIIGISAYAIGNGALFWGLKYLPATTTSFLMSISPLLILFAGTIWLKETPTFWQIVGVITAFFGSVLFFLPGLRPGEPLGIAIVAVGLIGFTAFGILGREIARDKQIDTLSLTAIPLGFGGALLLLVAFLLEGLPSFTPIAWGVVLWLAIVNTAVGYALYNHSLQILTALEMNVILNLAPLGTAVLAWLFLDEILAGVQIVGMVTVIIGVILVQQAGAH